MEKKKRKMSKKSRILMCMIVMSMLLFSCGTKEEDAREVDVNSHAAGEEYVYVPFLDTIEQESLGYLGMMEEAVYSDRIYYQCSQEAAEGLWYEIVLEYRKLEEPQTVYSIDLSFTQADYQANMGVFTLDEEENIYMLWYACPIGGTGMEEIWLVKYDSEGNAIKSVCLSEDLASNVNYVSDILVDKEGNLYVGTDSSLYVYSKKLSLEKTITTGRLESMFLLNGETVCGVRNNMKAELVAVDDKNATTEVLFDNISMHYGFFADGRNGRILWADNTKLYELDLETGESLVVLDWLEMNLNSGCISAFEVLSSGQFAIVYDDYFNDVTQVVTLQKTPRAQVKEKEVLTLATFTADRQELLDAVVAFNRESEEYRVEIKNYYTYTYDFSQEVYDDAVTLFHMDIINGEAPDLIYLPDVDVYNLADSQALEDLSPWLENSSVLKREDFVEEILQACEVDGKLVTIPLCIRLRTLLGKSRLVGEDAGWTLEDMMRLRETYPDAVFGWHWNRDEALRICLAYGWERFVDEETGECHFDSEEFKKVLEFARSFGPWGSGVTQEPYDSLQKDETVLLEEVISSVEHYQMLRLMIEEPSTAIGYPTDNGEAITLMMGWENYAIASRSDNKEGAWKFMESVLDETDTRRIYGFPTRTSLLEEMFAEAMTPEYEMDADGNILYDDVGNPIEVEKTTWGNGSWTAEIYAATEEEINVLRQMISTVHTEAVRSQTVMDIIKEEAAAYFADQKSAEEVAKIIQSRVQLYVSENR